MQRSILIATRSSVIAFLMVLRQFQHLLGILTFIPIFMSTTKLYEIAWPSIAPRAAAAPKSPSSRRKFGTFVGKNWRARSNWENLDVEPSRRPCVHSFKHGQHLLAWRISKETLQEDTNTIWSPFHVGVSNLESEQFIWQPVWNSSFKPPESMPFLHHCKSSQIRHQQIWFCRPSRSTLDPPTCVTSNARRFLSLKMRMAKSVLFPLKHWIAGLDFLVTWRVVAALMPPLNGSCGAQTFKSLRALTLTRKSPASQPWQTLKWRFAGYHARRPAVLTNCRQSYVVLAQESSLGRTTAPCSSFSCTDRKPCGTREAFYTQRTRVRGLYVTRKLTEVFWWAHMSGKPYTGQSVRHKRICWRSTWWDPSLAASGTCRSLLVCMRLAPTWELLLPMGTLQSCWWLIWWKPSIESCGRWR